MKILFSSNRNPLFETFTDYIENALKNNGHQTLFFENRDFIIPGRIRDRATFMHKWDLKRLNKKLLDIAKSYKPDIFLEDGGWNILPDTIEDMERLGIKTALWTNDVPMRFEPIIKAAPYYDFVFTAGTEAMEILKEHDIENLYWMPFACDPDFHRPVEVSDEEKKRYGCDICFVGSGTLEFYQKRKMILENLTDFDLGIWGPGWDGLPSESPLKKNIRGKETRPDEWVKIYSASKIVLCIHYHDPEGKVPCYQASPKVFEALACEAFLVVDKQKDILSFFNSGEHLVIFNNLKELREILFYYLNHPDEAKGIAKKGRGEVLKRHTYGHRIRDIIATIMKK